MTTPRHAAPSPDGGRAGRPSEAERAARRAELVQSAWILIRAGLDLWPAHVAALFGVDPKSVTRWAKAGKLTARRTLGGHRRYDPAEVKRLLEPKGFGEW